MLVDKNINNKIISVVGTRPEVLRVIRGIDNHLIVNTGQHYDYEMDEIFWKEMGFKPDINLNAKSLSEIYDGVYELLEKEKPALVICYGDTRSSLATALATKDLGFKLAHIEAGTRSGNMDMPEERNRIQIDAISDYLFPVNFIGKENLEKENVKGKIFVVGDIVYDRYLEKREHKDYILLTIHRKENQNSEFLKRLIYHYEDEKMVIFPIHPVMIKFLGKALPENLEIIKPVNHKKMLELIKNAKLVITDSGGVEREATFMGVPLRVMLENDAWRKEINIFGDGMAEKRIKRIIEKLC